MNPLLVNAFELLRRPGNEQQVEVAVNVADLDIVDPDRFAGDAEVGIHLRLEALSDGIVVDGQVSVPWHGICRRCLMPTQGMSVSEVHELYQRTITDPDAFEIVGEQIDLTPIARELALLDAPSTPLCRPDCAGLCPACGTDRNVAPCTCHTTAADPRWDGLEQLKGLVDDGG
ncbi:MAG: DUF177 domain-containing protein [Actinomycetota bacterium]